MYHAANQENFEKVNGLYTYFSILNRMFRKTIYLREGYGSHVPNYMRNLLARMREGALPFSVFDFVWEEIKIISQSPQNYCGLAPCWSCSKFTARVSWRLDSLVSRHRRVTQNS
jgi:hypothetical protein